MGGGVGGVDRSFLRCKRYSTCCRRSQGDRCTCGGSVTVVLAWLWAACIVPLPSGENFRKVYVLDLCALIVAATDVGPVNRNARRVNLSRESPPGDVENKTGVPGTEQ